MIDHILARQRPEKKPGNVFSFLLNQILAAAYCCIKETLCSFGEETQTLNFNIYSINETQT